MGCRSIKYLVLSIKHGENKIIYRFNSLEKGTSISNGTSEKRSFCHSLEEGNPGFKAKIKL